MIHPLVGQVSVRFCCPYLNHAEWELEAGNCPVCNEPMVPIVIGLAYEDELRGAVLFPAGLGRS